jgi:hypothetical protein
MTAPKCNQSLESGRSYPPKQRNEFSQIILKSQLGQPMFSKSGFPLRKSAKRRGETACRPVFLNLLTSRCRFEELRFCDEFDEAALMNGEGEVERLHIIRGGQAEIESILS